jgi:hypothetical protein
LRVIVRARSDNQREFMPGSFDSDCGIGKLRAGVVRVTMKILMAKKTLNSSRIASLLI